MNKSNFKKKVYQKLSTSPFKESISVNQTSSPKQPKKIIPTMATQGLREEFKKTFLPLLIEVFELRQSIENYTTQLRSPQRFSLGIDSKSPQEILSRLEVLQNDIEESERWCQGVILQIAKGVEEATRALGEREEGLIRRLIRRITK